jgi:hypothetical protein
MDCAEVRLDGVTLANSPFWTVHPLYCRDVTLSHLTIRNPHDAPNTDGIDIDSCSGVLIEHCTINVGDDGIALKAGRSPCCKTHERRAGEPLYGRGRGRRHHYRQRDGGWDLRSKARLSPLSMNSISQLSKVRFY